ncbi:hypothetical protein EGW08_005682 [Elysia chlorotica]|uniref:Mammalian ependymin-related protein 1 n=1 Tax=Elysia chlorotica TaxID=188477 RepID=A0A3S0ZTU9_ELYCH|nr:hypothetical protein EGW08_005682 [Elysia chlorotica]
MIVALALLLVAVVNAQLPQPCQTPPQWQGKFIRRDESKNFTQYADISYDLVNRRVREVEYVEEGTDRDYEDVLYLHNINKEYRINLKLKNCTVSALTRPFIHFGLPPDAKYMGTANIGPVNFPDEHATVILFEGEDKQEGTFYYGEVTTPDCVPVNTGFFTNRTGYVHTSFFDITGGIPDPSVFIPPTGCTPK